MKTAMRTYRIPVIVTALMVLVLGVWAWQTWQGMVERSLEWRRQHAAGFFDAFEGTIQALGETGGLDRKQIETDLARIIGKTPVRFVLVRNGGQRVLQAGAVPRALALDSTEGNRFTENLFLLWRPIHLGKAFGSARSVVPAAAASGMSPAGPIMILGVETHHDSRVPHRALGALITIVAAALLFVAASLAAWILTIRGRLLSEQLKSERARRAHLEELGLAAAGLAHETKNPLGIIFGIAQQISTRPEQTPESRAMLEHIVDEVDKASARLGNFMTFARQREVRFQAVDAKRLGESVVQVLTPDFEVLGVGLLAACAPIRILADEEMLRQILVNLLLNSLHASPSGTAAALGVTRQGSTASLTVTDRGRGIPPALLPDIFKPYVAGDPEGHGLGLAIVKRFVDAHGWQIRVESQVDRGTTVVIDGIGLAAVGETP